MERMVSIVIPFLDEGPAIETLYKNIRSACNLHKIHFELIMVNDGSVDDGPTKCQKLAAQNDNVVLINFRTNFGKAAALSAGFNKAKGEVIISMDADLQDDPTELNKFLEKIDEGFDVVSGWKKERFDPLGKRIISKIFNIVVSFVIGLRLHDYNCGFKAYTRQAIDELEIYGELHRFTPALLYGLGFRVAEIPIRHHPRPYGRSKYGLIRLFQGFLDLLVVLLKTRYRTRVIHFFGYTGIVFVAIGFVILLYLSISWFAGASIGARPLLFLGIMLTLMGVQFIGIGLVGELVGSKQITERDKYLIRDVYPPMADENQPGKHNKHQSPN